MKGALTISFDLELVWGLRRGSSDLARWNGIENVRGVVNSLLSVLAKYHISATWAAVGHLMLTEKDHVGGRCNYDLLAPSSSWFKGEWYEGIPPFGTPGAEMFYAPDIIEAIVSCPTYQELAAHTFSHVIMTDPACSKELARAELANCRQLGSEWGRDLKSVVFPRNQIAHREVLEETGYLAYRGLNSEWYWLGRANGIGAVRPGVLDRLARYFVLPLRFADERLALVPFLPAARKVGRLWEIPHGMFLPGFFGVSRFISEKMRLRKASRGMHAASKRGRIFGLYTHPHNFLSLPDRMIAVFDSICCEAAALRDAGRLEILPFEEIASRLEEGACVEWTKP